MILVRTRTLLRTLSSWNTAYLKRVKDDIINDVQRHYGQTLCVAVKDMAIVLTYAIFILINHEHD